MADISEKRGHESMRYELLSGDIICAKYEDGELYIINEQFAPLYLRDFKAWAEARAVSENRGYVARLLKSSSSLPMNAGAFETSLKSNCACITDNYWVREPESGLTYADVNYDSYDGHLAQLALGLNTDPRDYRSSGSNPELTNIGDSNKAWVMDNKGNRWLYKRQLLRECYNEILSAKIAKRLGIATVEYELVSRTEDPETGRWGLIRSKDFTQNRGINLEHASLILEHAGIDESDVNGNAKVFREYGCEKEYLGLIYLDRLTGNGDRHSRNYGVLRNQSDGKVIGLAPNYDNNYAFTRDLNITEFAEAAAGWNYVPPVLTEGDLDVLGEEMRALGCDATKQLRDVAWKQKSIVNEISKAL